MALTIDTGDIIAALALLLSVYATWKTSKFTERQKSLIESQEELNRVLLQKGRNEALVERRADLGASFIAVGNHSHRLKIWNKGKATARGVRIEFPEGNDVIVQSDIEKKFPLEALDSFQAVELSATVVMGTKRKLAVKLVWSDDHSPQNEKTIYPTL